jgi:YVTN family beta-propeller protein
MSRHALISFQSLLVFLVALGAVFSSGARADSVSATITAGTAPCAINLVTNKIYVSSGASTVTVIDGADNSTVTTLAGSCPVMVNPVSNKVYVSNGSTFTVFDGTDHTPQGTVAATSGAFAINPVTNKIYIANRSSNSVTVIDGADNTTATVAVGTQPVAIAVNPVTNKIYVANSSSFNVSVIDGADNSSVTLPPSGTGTVFPFTIAVNPVTNRIYVGVVFPFGAGGFVQVIDGSNDTTVTNVAAGGIPQQVAVNPVTNKIYLLNGVKSGVSTPPSPITIIDGADNTATNVNAGLRSSSIAVNPTTGKIYVTNFSSNDVTVIDGADNTTTTAATGTGPSGVLVNPVTNKIYVGTSGGVMVIDGTPAQTIANAMTTTIDVASTSPRGSDVPVTFTANTSLTGTPDSSRQVYYQLDSIQGPWQLAAGSAPSYSASLAAPALGTHVLYAFTVDGSHVEVASPVIGPIAAASFTVVDNVPPPAPGTTRFEENAATQIGFWTGYGAETGTFSGGGIVASNIVGSTALFSFTGTAVSWIGVKCNVCGIALVTVDGGAPTTVNTAGPNAPGSLTSEPVFSASGLAATGHMITITVTGTSSSTGTYVAVDAFDVTAGSATSPILPSVALPPPPVTLPPLPPLGL